VLQPTTELDPRFSDTGATPTGWTTTLEVIEAAELFWISTVRSDGRPHVTPLVSVWMDGAAHFAAGPEEQKTVNLASNPHVVLSTGSNDWRRGIDVMIEGRAERVTDHERLELLAELWRKKWDGRWRSEPTEGGFRSEVGGPAHVYEVRPTKVLAFAKGEFGHTRHRFPG
jgi:nitroimidazol reductase NimA-like FMN-containing flavoprotein (pyridoxamine 5'-phosphate oxidase superfamily)